MVTLRNRLERLEKAQRFRYWLRHQRFLEGLTDEQLEFYVVTGCPPDVPEPLPGTSRLDKLDKRTLAKMWKEDERQFGGRGKEPPIYRERSSHGSYGEYPMHWHLNGERAGTGIAWAVIFASYNTYRSWQIKVHT